MKKSNLQLEIDSDEGLNSKKRLLTITSLILLAIQFTGAKIVEANTFILKIEFSHQKGLALLLFLSVVFLLIRFYSYARKYHLELHNLWTSELMRDPRIDYFDPHEQELYGWLHEKYPKDFDPFVCGQDEFCSYKTKYNSTWLINKRFQFDISDEHHSYTEYINIYEKLGIKVYLSIFIMELKYKVFGFIKHRENLDIISPYLLGLLAIASFVLPEEFERIIKYIMCL